MSCNVRIIVQEGKVCTQAISTGQFADATQQEGRESPTVNVLLRCLFEGGCNCPFDSLGGQGGRFWRRYDQQHRGLQARIP